mmetsp:Transcript_40009/g.84034  ORF Transcript_40009/g.84034 Transcript_40009/m.84034 type:complete len:191 (+) Transcript_40009:150-722(+)
MLKLPWFRKCRSRQVSAPPPPTNGTCSRESPSRRVSVLPPPTNGILRNSNGKKLSQSNRQRRASGTRERRVTFVLQRSQSEIKLATLDSLHTSLDLWFSDDDCSISSVESEGREIKVQPAFFDYKKQGSNSSAVCSSDMSYSSKQSSRETRHQYEDSYHQRTKLSLLIDQKIAAKMQRLLRQEQRAESST